MGIWQHIHTVTLPTCGLCHENKSEWVMFSNQGQDNEIQSDSTDSSNTQPSNWQGPNQRSLVISSRVPFKLFILIWVQDWFIVGFILIQDLSQSLHQIKFHAPSSNCCRVSPLLNQRKFHAVSSHCWRVSPLLHQRKFHAASSHCWRVSPSLSRQEFHATPSHRWCVRP